MQLGVRHIRRLATVDSWKISSGIFTVTEGNSNLEGGGGGWLTFTDGNAAIPTLGHAVPGRLANREMPAAVKSH